MYGPQSNAITDCQNKSENHFRKSLGRVQASAHTKFVSGGPGDADNRCEKLPKKTDFPVPEDINGRDPQIAFEASNHKRTC
jgi:hypothetical protein